jgi:hypothetical protein
LLIARRGSDAAILLLHKTRKNTAKVAHKEGIYFVQTLQGAPMELFAA